MAYSVVDICNLALAHLGDKASVSSLSPPDSLQAQHCAKFYPLARDGMLERRAWGFATTRVLLSELDATRPEWDHCYARPADAIRLLAVLPSDASDDTLARLSGRPVGTSSPFFMPYAADQRQPQQYVDETLEDGTRVIWTDQEDAALRYVRRVEDPTKFSPLFVETLAAYLASMLAGPIIKGDVGRAEGKRMLEVTKGLLGDASVSDANQRNVRPAAVAPWIGGR